MRTQQNLVFTIYDRSNAIMQLDRLSWHQSEQYDVVYNRNTAVVCRRSPTDNRAVPTPAKSDCFKPALTLTGWIHSIDNDKRTVQQSNVRRAALQGGYTTCTVKLRFLFLFFSAIWGDVTTNRSPLLHGHHNQANEHRLRHCCFACRWIELSKCVLGSSSSRCER